MTAKHFSLYLLFISALALSPCYGDTTAPRPSPAKWRIVPITLGPNSIQMAAVTALDQAGSVPIQYLFECSNIPSASSTWQTDTNYIATGLTESTVYTFRVRARDSALNQTSWALARSATTDAVTTPPVLRLDLNYSQDNNEPNTQTSFVQFSTTNTGSEVNGIIIDLSGSINTVRRDDPCGSWSRYAGTPVMPGDPCYYSQRAGERIYRDFVYGVSPSGVTITLWGLGTNRDCNITIWAWDARVTGDVNRVAKWYANGTHLFDADFIGGVINQPLPDNYSSSSSNDFWKWAFSGRATSDDFGRIILTSERGPSSPENQPFAFVNAIQVEPNASIAFAETPYAQRPVPFNGAEDAPIDAVLSWLQGGLAETHDIYFGTNETAVTDANRSNTLGVLVSQDHSTTSYDSLGLLNLNTTYYWRIDEVNDAPDYTIFKGEVWSFTTSSYFVMEDFDSYGDDSELEAVWDTDSTAAEISVETTISIDGNSMKYSYDNNLPPYYSEVYADIADLGINNHDWLGLGANALVLNLHGQMTNPIGEQMYVRLTDGDNPAGTKTVYDNINYAKYEQWNGWNIALTKFNDVNLANIASITIGFGDGRPGDTGTVYLDDITLDTEVVTVEPKTVNIDLNTTHQTIRGFGGMHFPRWSHGLLNDADVDTAFGNGPGQIGMTIMRIDVPPNDTDWSGQVWAPYRAINTHGAIVFASPWSPPASMKTNNNLVGGQLSTGSYGAYATYLSDFADYMSDNNAPLYAVSLQNEPDVTVSYESCDWTSTQMRNFLVNNASVIPTRVMVAESYRFARSFTDPILNDPSAEAQTDIIAGHIYGGGLADYPLARSKGKEIWMTEHYTESAHDADEWPLALGVGKEIHDCMAANMNAYIWWYIKRYYGLMEENGGNITKRGYCMSHFAKFVRPGYVRVSATANPASGVYITAYKSDDTVVIVAVNQNSSSQTVTFSLSGGSVDSYTKYVTSSSNNVDNMSAVGRINFLAGNSINTFVGTIISNCADVLSAGYGLTSDISGDCHVDYEDLKIMSDNWLRIDCAEEENCEGADFTPTDGNVNFFDFARFAEQWLLCNDPEDAGCMENW
ncbi:MAG: glycoside hydrolase family 30 beta sandwich domain-containing protein [Phycisphaerae bacterium]|nr:glycoside hydrolase family 30 beta sandwich domain-containing protein [Phycisphaerae bacterium]MDD5380246.1 glycoside hydrolase family 30 beta sandwich domain-containing protein [Phycisphaerae bacterium]